MMNYNRYSYSTSTCLYLRCMITKGSPYLRMHHFHWFRCAWVLNCEYNQSLMKYMHIRLKYNYIRKPSHFFRFLQIFMQKIGCSCQERIVHSNISQIIDH